MIRRFLMLLLLVMRIAVVPGHCSPDTRPVTSARPLTIRLWTTRTIKTVLAAPLIPTSGAPEQVRVQWTPAGMRVSPASAQTKLSLSGMYHLQAGGVDQAPQEVTAAGEWTITWRRDGLRVLLTLPSERYVAAAVNGEAAPDEPLAALKAMAITIRTYALAHSGRHSGEGFGLCDSTHCQALRLGRTRPEVERAVRETAGETLWFAGRRAHVYFTQHCGGTSEAASSVWPAEGATYLAGQQKDPYCLRRSAADWHARVPLTTISDIFRAQGWRTPSPIATIEVTRRSATGRAEMLRITGPGKPALVSASSFRFAVDRALGWNQMRSDWYTASVSGPALEMTGRGFGHGVGLCQAGAFEMAKEGRNEAEILKFYFPGVRGGITAADHGWQRFEGAGWTLLTTQPAGNLLAAGNAAWARAQSLLGDATGVNHPLVEDLPSTELFRQTTSEPGWMLGSVRGSDVFLQPVAVRRANGGTEGLLLHEFLHVLVERQASERAPLWLREGLVTMLSDANQPASGELPQEEVIAILARPASEADSRRAHQAAAQMTRRLCSRYGMPAVREFLRNGLPAGVLSGMGM